jgi:histidinol dehydrogenase
MASNDEGRHKKTLKRRAATAIDVDLKLKNLRKVIESDDMNDAVEVEETSPEHLGISVVQPHEVLLYSIKSAMQAVLFYTLK